MSTGAPAVSSARLLATLAALARIGATKEGGVSRPAYGDDDVAARAAVRDFMRQAALAVRVDSAGNTFATRPGRSRGAPALIIGSHTDSVPDGGRFDGALGVAAAIEVAHTLDERDIVLAHPLEVVDFRTKRAA